MMDRRELDELAARMRGYLQEEVRRQQELAGGFVFPAHDPHWREHVWFRFRAGLPFPVAVDAACAQLERVCRQHLQPGLAAVVDFLCVRGDRVVVRMTVFRKPFRPTRWVMV